MIAFHAQGRENDTIWLNSKLKPYKFNRAILEILGQTPLRTQECEVGVAKVMSLGWERKQSCEMGTREREKRRPGTLWRGERGPQSHELSPGRANEGGGLGEGGKSMPVYFGRRVARGLSSSQR